MVSTKILILFIVHNLFQLKLDHFWCLINLTDHIFSLNCRLDVISDVLMRSGNTCNLIFISENRFVLSYTVGYGPNAG